MQKSSTINSEVINSPPINACLQSGWNLKDKDPFTRKDQPWDQSSLICPWSGDCLNKECALTDWTVDESRKGEKRMNKRQNKSESDLYGILHNGTKDEPIRLAVSLGYITANSTSDVLQSSNDWPQTGINLTLDVLLKGFSLCLADEELTSSGTMAEWEKSQGCHRPSGRHTLVFDQGVVTLSEESLKPGPGSGDRVRSGLEESP